MLNSYLLLTATFFFSFGPSHYFYPDPSVIPAELTHMQKKDNNKVITSSTLLHSFSLDCNWAFHGVTASACVCVDAELEPGVVGA